MTKPEDIMWLYQHAVAVAGSCFKVWYCGRYENKGSGLMSVSLSQDCVFEALPCDAIADSVTCRVWAEIPGDSVAVLFEAVLVEVRGHFFGMVCSLRGGERGFCLVCSGLGEGVCR